MPGEIHLRPVADGDEPFLLHLYASTRESELAKVGWSAGQKASFVAQQFEAQSRQYAQYPGADYRVVLEGVTPVGRLYLSRTAEEIRVVDVAIVPERRGQGIGTALLADVLAEGERDGKPVGIHVEAFNPARRLYERLGFVVQPGHSGNVYLYMVRGERPR